MPPNAPAPASWPPPISSTSPDTSPGLLFDESLSPTASFHVNSNLVWASTSLKGRKSGPQGLTNQDSKLEIPLVNSSDKDCAFGVFDGHGREGSPVSEFLVVAMRRRLRRWSQEVAPEKGDATFQRWLTRQMDELDAELRTQNIDYLYSGSTALVVVRRNRMLHVCWIGDSRLAAFCFEMDPSGQKPDFSKSALIFQTSDHCPNREDEKARVMRSGGYVRKYENPMGIRNTYRVHPHGIAMSRSIGDLAARRYGVTGVSEYRVLDLDDPTGNGSKSPHRWLLILGSDGFWDTTRPEVLAKGFVPSVLENPRRAQLKRALDHLTTRVQTLRWAREHYCDDTTVIALVM